jgi:hypothetical protein
MTTLILIPGSLLRDNRRDTTVGLATWWNQLLETSGWNGRRLAWTRRELLRRAEEHGAAQSSYAADLRGAALGHSQA